MFLLLFIIPSIQSSIPLVITTWASNGFQKATANAFSSISNGRLNSLIEGLSTCEILQCDGTVGYGGSPDEKGETTLDALLIDSDDLRMGAVAGMKRIKDAAKVAVYVMNYTRHTLIVGEDATRFAIEMGFKEESLYTNESEKITRIWKDSHCQPNYRKNVLPNPNNNCGPYKPNVKIINDESWNNRIDRFNHDTIGMIVIDKDGGISTGTSTNGATHKISGRVGDSPIPGSGAYLIKGIGGAAATGDGDIMMRLLPSYNAVDLLRRGKSPIESANESMKRIIDIFPHFMGGIIVASVNGSYGASCTGLDTFSFSIQSINDEEVRVESVQCI